MRSRAPWLVGVLFFASALSYVACGSDDSNGGTTAGSDASSDSANGGDSSKTCGAPKTKCPSGACLDLQTDSRNCGACAYDCRGGTCAAGLCQPAQILSSLVTPSN